jgi:hypothetical protein
MKVLDGALHATLFTVPPLLRRCLELADNDLMLKLSQELFTLDKPESQRRHIADLRTRHLAKRDVGDLAVTIVHGQDQVELHAIAPSFKKSVIVRHRPTAIRASPPHQNERPRRDGWIFPKARGFSPRSLRAALINSLSLQQQRK